MTTEGINVVHNADKNRFEVQLPSGDTAVLDYRLKQQPGTLTITHTYVPHAFEGRGVASRMTQAALDYAHSHDLSIVPLCSFAAAYIVRQERRA
jgi:predicted GNAT family acetyltransferase